MEQTIHEIAECVFGFDIKPRNSDGYDFFDSDRGSIGVRGLERALQLAYEAGAAAERKRLEETG